MSIGIFYNVSCGINSPMCEKRVTTYVSFWLT